ncbi:proton-coupled amino acid transporter 2-like isoform X2 [Ruditapes philippinarum]|nr:proton-coupled amino acid transporter 2-like isoform X2 [Ruditapes philippinarum]
MFVIAFLTDHCCHLIVKTKHHGIKGMIKKHTNKTPDGASRQRDNYSCNSTPRDSGVDDDEYDNNEGTPCVTQTDSEDNSDFEVLNHADIHENITKNMSYGDVGNLAFGSVGVGIVNFCIGLTQFGFCVNYFIFIGNTLHSLFPVHLCFSDNKTHERICKDVHDNDIKFGNLTWTEYSSHDNILDTYSADILTDNFISTLAPILTTVTPNISTTLQNVTTILPNITTLAPNASTILPNITTITPNVTTITPNASTFAPITNATTSVPWTLIPELVYTAPDLKILVICPIVVFILFALIRNVRYLGVISMIANFSILFGCVSVLVFILIDFKISDSIIKFRIEGFPVFFGMVTGAFEGIGLVIPVESSMVGNRHLFSAFLHGAILFLTVVLGCFGIMGYMKYGVNVHQMLNQNIPAGNPVSVAVNIGICLGILLTFPLQIFPVIEIIEKYLFSEGRICGPSKQVYRRLESDGEDEALMPHDKTPTLGHENLVAHVPDSVPAWKRNVLRIGIVVLAGGLAVILKDNFAYVGAFVGAVGSSVLAFILPCLFHLRLCWNELNVFIKFKDIFIIVFGVFASIISVISVIQRIVKNVDIG